MQHLSLRDIMAPEDMKYIRHVATEPLWVDYHDGSGHFVGVTGRDYFNFDFDTNEIKVNGRWQTPIQVNDIAWQDYYAGIYCRDMMHTDLQSAEYESRGIEPVGCSHDPVMRNPKCSTVALGENIGFSAAEFSRILDRCHTLETRNFSDSTLHCDELAAKMLNAIKAQPEGPDYMFTYENADIHFSAEDVTELEEVESPFYITEEELGSFWDIYDRIALNNPYNTLPENISQAVDCYLSVRESRQADEEEL